MDRITENLLQSFVSEQSLTELSSSDAFEYFANFCAVSKEYSDTFDVADVSSGTSTGIDGIALIANGNLVTTEDEIADLISTNKYLDVTFVFIQAKTSSAFETGEIGNFCFAVKDFFSQSPQLQRNEFVEKMGKLQEFIYKNSVHFTKGKPCCKLYYVTTGKWVEDPTLVARIAAERKDIEDTVLFRSVSIQPVDADGLQALYADTKSKISAEFAFPNKALLPEIAGVKEAYIGVIPASDYVKLITDESGKIRKSLFYDNVRDFQDYNEVNQDIRSTLASAAPDRFAILNNGVTIVAKSLTPIRDSVRIEDYQIVNGCQTSHVLFDEKNAITNQVYITVKLISTKDDAITNAVIKATNLQTPVKVEELTAMSDFQKKLESYYETFTDSRQRLYYERRSRQYSNSTEPEKVRIVTIPLQIKSFASMFLNLPDKAGRYYGTLLTSNLKRMFLASHNPAPYYTAAYANYKLESLFRRGLIDRAYRKFRDPLLLILRIQIAGMALPDFSSKKIEAYCNEILEELWDDDKAMTAVSKAVSVIDSLGVRDHDRGIVKTQSFTESVIRAAKSAISVPTK